MKKGGWSGWAPIAALFLWCFGVRGESVAVVKMQEALTATEEMRQAVTDLEKRYQPRRERLANWKADWIARVTKFHQPVCGTGPGMEESRKMERFTKDLNLFQADLERDEAASLRARLEPVRRRMLQVIASIAEAKGLVLVLDTKPAYVVPNLDLTTEAVAAYNKFHPVN